MEKITIKHRKKNGRTLKNEYLLCYRIQNNNQRQESTLENTTKLEKASLLSNLLEILQTYPMKRYQGIELRRRLKHTIMSRPLIARRKKKSKTRAFLKKELVYFVTCHGS